MRKLSDDTLECVHILTVYYTDGNLLLLTLKQCLFYCVLNQERKTKAVMVTISHMMSPLAGIKLNQNQNLEAYTHIDMQRYVESSWCGIISFKLHKNYKEFEWKTNKNILSSISHFCSHWVFSRTEITVKYQWEFSRHRYFPINLGWKTCFPLRTSSLYGKQVL